MSSLVLGYVLVMISECEIMISHVFFWWQQNNPNLLYVGRRMYSPHFSWGLFVELRGQVERGCAVARRSCEHQFDRLKFLCDVRKFGGFELL